MPKDEFDFEDPLELSGVALLTHEDTTDAMCECFVEEFMRMGYHPKQILALFRNPHYLGLNMVLQNRGEAFVRDVIAETFARWGRSVAWPDVRAAGSVGENVGPEQAPRPRASQGIPVDESLTDPMGAAIPKLEL